MSAPTPKAIKRSKNKGIEITWSDGSIKKISSETLRKNCPSAISKANRGDTSHDKPIQTKKTSLKIIEHSSKEELDLKRIWQIGNYAIGIEWGDGHDSGIFSFELLYKLSKQ